MADLPTRLDLYGLGRSYILGKAKSLSPAKVDVAGSNANIYVGSQSVVGASVVRQLGYGLSRLILDSITNDEDLDRYAWDRYQLTRKGAAAGVTDVTFARTSAAAGSGAVPIGQIVGTLSGIQYVTTSAAPFGASDLTSKANVRASVAGSASAVPAGNLGTGVGLTRVVPTPGIVLWDNTLTVVNQAASSGNDDAEDLETFKNRIRGFWLAARRGTLGAIEFGALQVLGVTSASAVEALDGGGFPARIVTLYVADGSGNSNAQLAQAVAVGLGDFRAGGIKVVINTSVPTIVSIVLKLQFQANVDSVSVTQAVVAAVVEFVNSLAVNGTLYLADLYSVLRRYSSDGLIVSQGTIVSPAGDVVPGIGRTLRMSTGDLQVAA